MQGHRNPNAKVKYTQKERMCVTQCELNANPKQKNKVHAFNINTCWYR